MRYNSNQKQIKAHTRRYTTKLMNCNCLLVHERPKLANIMHCSQKGPYFRDRVPIGTLLTFWVPIGSLFIFQGPYFHCFG